MSHSHGQLPVNPNSNRNRAPQGTELASLRATASHLQSVIDLNTQAAKAALERYEEIKVRYDAHALILDEIGSELHAAKLSADVLGEHAASLEPKLQELRGLLHPIRRCSDDVLRLIFEERVADQVLFYQDGFVAATDLSHVCRRWRSIALSTPTLWAHVIFQPQSSTEAAVSKAVAFLDRVKVVPTTIHIEIDGDDVEYTANIPLSTIYRAPVISSLFFSTHGNSAAVLEAVSVFPNRHIDELQLLTWDRSLPHLGPFLSKFRSFRKFESRSGYFGSFISSNLSNSLSKLEEIELTYVNEVPIVDLLALAPQIRIFKMYQCHIKRNSEGGIDQCTSHNLRYYSMHGGGVPWNKISAPALMELSVYRLPGIVDPDGFWDFLSRCHAITSMTVDDSSPEQFALLVDSVPELRELTVSAGIITAIASILMESQLPSPPFPRLERLKLSGSRENIEAATLETLIRSRCLFRGHPESTMDDGIQQALGHLEIEIGCFDVEWSHTPFLEKYLVKASSNEVVYRVVA